MERRKLFFTLGLIIFFNLSFLSAEEFGYNLLELPTFNNNTAFVNETANWVTPSLGILSDVNATQHSNEAGVLNIKESWISSLWCRLTGCTIDGNINITGNLTLPSLTKGSVLFVGDNGAIIEDDLFYDNVNKRLGINTITPSSQLEVFGDDPRITSKESTNGQSVSFEAGTQGGEDRVRANFVLKNDVDNDLINAGMFIHPDGTPQKQTFVEVMTSGDVSTANTKRIQISQSPTLGSLRTAAGDGSDSGTPLHIYVRGTTTQLYLKPDGKIGIRTTTPNNNLHVKTGTNGNGITLQRSSITADTYVDLKFLITQTDSFDPVTYIRTFRRTGVSDNDMLFHVGGTDVMTILDNGNIGIGTIDPQNSLDVSGAQVIGSSYAGINTAPSDGLLVEGDVGIGTTSPDSKLQIDGNFTSETNATDSIGTRAIQWLSGFFVNLFVSNDLVVGGDINISGKIHNSLSHAYGLSTEIGIVNSIDTWYNITMNASLIDTEGMTAQNDNVTIIIGNNAHYTITYGMGVQDSSPLPTAHVGMRWTVNDVEIIGSYIEVDTTKQTSDQWVEHTVHTELETGDLIRMQYISSDTDVTIQEHGTYATQPFNAFGYIQEIIV